MGDSTDASARRMQLPVHNAIAASIVFLALATAPATAAGWHSKQELTAGNPSLAKVSSHLLRARLFAAEKLPAADIAAAVPSARMQEGRLAVDVSLFRLDEQILAALRTRGLLVDSYNFKYARAYGRIDPARLADVAAHAEVSTIQPMPRKLTRTGSVANQADVTMNSDDVRNDLGYDGTGVTVGILSDSFRDLSAGSVTGSGCNRSVTGTSSQSSGDLPNLAGDVISLDDGPPGLDTDEGRAMGELVFDIVPGANFMFHSAFNSPADFAAGITELVDCGADLIVDDVGYTQQPFFQDGDIAQAAQGAVDAAVPYFSAAGNDAWFGVNDPYTDSNPESDDTESLPDGDDFHDFGGGDRFAAITIPNGCDIYTELQWSEPFSGALGPGASSDLDLWLLNSEADPLSTNDTNVLDASVTLQGCGAGAGNPGNPLEFIHYSNNTGGSETVYMAVNHHCGNEDVRLRIINLSFDCDTTSAPFDFEDGGPGETPIFVDAQIFGHPAATDVIAVAASFYGEVDSGGTEVAPPGQLDVEPFSSLGGDLPFYFDGGGSPLAFALQSRFKPEVTGPDGTNNTFLGDDLAFDPDSLPNFSGTSAAAANAAAVAALILDATDLKINPLPLKQLLSQAALDMETPGLDDLSGFGFTDALRPISSLNPGTTPLIDELDFDLDGGAFFNSLPAGGLQRIQAIEKLTFGGGIFGGLEGIADTIIFTDGFESGDTSAWGHPAP